MDTARYEIRQHEDHFHVIDTQDEQVLLDDRPTNPWHYDDQSFAEAVVTLLNRGVSTQEIRLMDGDEIRSAARAPEESTLSLQSYQQGVAIWGRAGMDKLGPAATIKLIGASVHDPEFADRIQEALTEIHTRTWAIEGTTEADVAWLAELVAPNNGVAVWEEGWVVIDANAFNYLVTLDADFQDGAIEEDNGLLTMYANGDGHRVVMAQLRGSEFGRG